MLKTNKYLFSSILYLLIYLIISTNVSAQDSTVYSAKSATLYKAVIETKNEGYSDSAGYINFDNEIGGFAEWKIFMEKTDTQNVSIRYANASTSNRYMNLFINDTLVKSLDFNTTNSWTFWDINRDKILLKSGLNRIKLVGAMSEGGPNIDFIAVTGEKAKPQFTLNANTFGHGIIDIEPNQVIYEDSTIVTLTAIADSNWIFKGWFGSITSNDNPLVIKISKDLNINANFSIVLDSNITFNATTPIGFASVNAMGINGTTGGLGGDTIVVSTGNQLYDILESRRDENYNDNNEPLTILVDGKLTWNVKDMMDVKGNYDLSIIGKGNNAQIEEFGLNIFKSFNVIVRNIEFRNCHDDAISIADELTHHIWIDHCTFSDDPESGLTDDNHDGLLDIKDGANYVTVSWNHFYNHRKTSLVGHSDNHGDVDIGKLKVTYHHNWFDNTNQRNPRVRFGECHIFNNFYDNQQGIMMYGVASTMEADVVVESNYFLDVSDPTHSGQAASGPGDVVEFNNIYDNSGEPEIRGSAFLPNEFYYYKTDSTHLIPELVQNYAGSGKLEGLTDIGNEVLETSSFKLMQNYPNPFNPTTEIQFQLPKKGDVQIKVYNILGELVSTLLNEELKAGYHSTYFNAGNLSSGIYFYSIKVGDFVDSKKMILLK